MEIPFEKRFVDDSKQVDYASDTWVVVQDYLHQQERLAMNEIRRQGLDVGQTEHLRGRLALIQKIFNDIGPPSRT